jgi:hypothetical protein
MLRLLLSYPNILTVPHFQMIYLAVDRLAVLHTYERLSKHCQEIFRH